MIVIHGMVQDYRR